MANANEMVASQNSGGAVWLPVLVGSVISGAVSATVGYMIGARPKATACSCKKTPKAETSSEKA